MPDLSPQYISTAQLARLLEISRIAVLKRIQKGRIEVEGVKSQLANKLNGKADKDKF